MNYQAVVFDLDGVICCPAYRFSVILEKEYQLTREDTKAFFIGRFQDCLVGKADLKVEIGPFLRQWGWHETVDAFLNRWFEEESFVDDKLLEAIQGLRGAGIACYVATNQEQYRTTYVRSVMGFVDLFDGVFASAEVGVLKPDLQFYARVTQALQVIPTRVLFWDDTLENIKAARQYGWQAQHYTGHEHFSDYMEQHLSR